MADHWISIYEKKAIGFVTLCWYLHISGGLQLRDKINDSVCVARRCGGLFLEYGSWTRVFHLCASEMYQIAKHVGS
jgi:hypothetical protein